MTDTHRIASRSAGKGADFPFLRGGGEMGRLIREHDWGATAIGPPGGWPPALATAVGVLLNTGQPMYIWWGPQLLCLYNDAYRESIGSERHPASLGAPGRAVWDEIWPIIGPQIARVMAGGGGTSHVNALVPITRNGRREDVYWTYSYSPLYDPAAASGVGGVLVVCTETTDQVLMAQRAAEERRRFAELFEQAPTFMAMLRGPEHRIDLANPGYLRLIGNRNVLGRTVSEALPEVVAQGYVERLDAVYASGEPYLATGAKFDVQVTPDGALDERYIDFVYQPIKDAGGAVTGIFVQGVDVTRRAMADAALRDSEEQLRLATEAAEVGLWDVDVVNDELYWPPRVKAMFGISADEPVSMADFYASLHPEDRDATVAAYAAAVNPRLRALYDVEYRTVGRKDGVVRWVAAKGRAIFDRDRCVRVLGTAIDISARKAAEEELRDLNESLERRVTEALAERKVFLDIVEATDARILVLSRDFRIMAVNKATVADIERIYGVRAKVGDRLVDLLQHEAEHRDIVQRYWSRALAGEEFTAVDEFGDPDLDRRCYEMKFNSLRDRNGDLVGAFQFAYDVTERLRDQARLAEAERQLRQAQKIDALGQLTGGVAHDFNNLLMVISGGLSLLERAGDPQRRMRIIGQMRQAAERGASLCRHLLAFARRQPLNPQALDLRRQIDGMRELLDRTLRGDVQVRTDLAPDLWPIKVDPAELELALLNLCVNSRDAMPNGGVITLAANNLRDVRDGRPRGEFVSVSVSDTGTGMSADVLSHIFEPFFTTKEIGKGSGLGLPQVYGFAQQSGGSVKVESTAGRGTVVTLLLPRSSESAASISAEPGAMAAERPQATLGSILLVEDDDEVAALVSEMFRELGYRVTRAASAPAALGALADHRELDLVFTDVMMPGSMNGMDLVREIRRRRPEIPVLLTTGYAGTALKAAEVENIEVLLKPYEIDALDAALRASLSKS